MALTLTLRRRFDDRIYFFGKDGRYNGDVQIAVGDGGRENVKVSFKGFDGIRILRSPHVLDGDPPKPRYPESAKRPQSVRSVADETRTPFGPESAK